MKSLITWLSVGVLASALTAAGVTSFLAWDSITARSELSKHPTLANLPIATSSPAPLATSVVQKLPAESSSLASPALGQDENNYLFDLSQSLQTEEQHRLTSEQQLEIAHNILNWLKEGSDYWGVRDKFDAAYRDKVLGDYAHNRDVYIRFATQWLAPDHLATLKQPGATDAVATGEVATDVPAEISSQDNALNAPMADVPYPDADVEPYVPGPDYSMPPAPYAYPHQQPYGQPNFDPYAVPYRANPGPSQPPMPHLRSISSRG